MTSASTPIAAVTRMLRRRQHSADEVAASPYRLSQAVRHGDFITYASALLFGLGNMLRHQIIKGLIFLAVEIGLITYLAMVGAPYLAQLGTLGTRKQGRVKVNGFWIYQAGDSSIQILLYGVMSLSIIVVLLGLAALSVQSAYKAQVAVARGERPLTFSQDLHSLGGEHAATGLMFLPTLGILVFTVLPLIFMISMAFTNYDQNNVVLFHWVGLDNFAKVFSSGAGDVNAGLFVSVVIWTLVWAFFATFLNFFLGMFMAMLINRKTTHWKSFWRACFSMSIAVPQFVSLLVMHTMLQPDGAINRLLNTWGFIQAPLPFLTDTTWARATVIIINLWIGIPFTIMQITGILQNVPADLYEAAQIDGATWWERFQHVTMPYIYFVMTPYLITTFTGNVNNFNVIYLLSGGAPTPIGSSAGSTDLLITWLYKLTVDRSNYNMGAVIGIMTFIVLAVISLITYRNSGSYKNEGGFR